MTILMSEYIIKHKNCEIKGLQANILWFMVEHLKWGKNPCSGLIPIKIILVWYLVLKFNNEHKEKRGIEH